MDTLIKFLAAIMIMMTMAAAIVARPALAGDISAADAGARYGQAVAAAKICPGGVVTDKAKALKASFIDGNASTFQAEADKVTEGWDKVFNCVERDPNTGRTTSCRKMKLVNCRQAWLEIGPEGKAVAGLLDLNFDGLGKDE
jgi:hypothetical protein